MAYAFPPDVQQLIREAATFSKYATEDDLLRDAFAALIRQNDDLVAINEGVADMEAGRVRPIQQVDSEIRSRLGFASGE